MQKWEYLFLACYGYSSSSNISYDSYYVFSNGKKSEVKENATIYCNKLGQDGWEMAGISERGYDNDYMTIIFKRPKS